jgi:hypothetical protein
MKAGITFTYGRYLKKIVPLRNTTSIREIIRFRFIKCSPDIYHGMERAAWLVGKDFGL